MIIGLYVAEYNGDEEVEEVEIDDENYYSIPSWDSSDGFELMENFTAGLHNPNGNVSCLLPRTLRL